VTDRLPDHDPTDPVETAVIRGLVRSWPRRATVRRDEPQLDGPTMEELFDPQRTDFPEEMLPIRGHPRYEALDEAARRRINSWAWIAYNKNVMDIEQSVVSPGFGVLFRDALGTGFSDAARTAVMQALVDEEYHTLMHLNGSALVRRRRGWSLPDRSLPDSLMVRKYRAATSSLPEGREAALVALGFSTVAETSIGEYLSVISADPNVQPVNRATVSLHRRDETAHSSVAGEMVRLVHDRLNAEDRAVLRRSLHDAVDAFTATDFGVWSAILASEQVPDGDEMLRECADDPARRRFVQDCGATDRLIAEFDD
jgi:alpha-N-dichloroacetyl-p-aminophenylserinol N-oxygenase